MKPRFRVELGRSAFAMRLIGLVAGYAFGYYVTLNGLEKLAHALFWSNLVEHGTLEVWRVLRSSTFWKLATSSFVGWLVIGQIPYVLVGRD